MNFAVQQRNELAGGARLGGRVGGHEGYEGNCSLWKGRPPRLESAFGLAGFSIAAQVEAPADLGLTALIDLELGNSWGGIIRRSFNVGAGLSADLRLGTFEHVKATVIKDDARGGLGLPAGLTVYFCWTWELNGRGHLRLYQPVAANTILQAPEGAEALTPQNDCTMVWQAPSYGSTFTQSLVGGVEVPTVFPTAFSCNIDTLVVWRLRGI